MSENQFDNMPLGFLNALMATVVGTDEQARQAKEFLAREDPDTWQI